MRILIPLVLLAGTGAAICFAAWPGAPTRAARLTRVGLASAVVGAAWTIVAWWLVVPEIILAAGIGLLVLARISTRRSMEAGRNSVKP